MADQASLWARDRARQSYNDEERTNPRGRFYADGKAAKLNGKPKESNPLRYIPGKSSPDDSDPWEAQWDLGWDETPKPSDSGDAPDESNATFAGQKPNQGRVVIGDIHPGEGYATLKCGNTEVQISYTVLHGVNIDVSAFSSQIRDMEALRKAFHSITCEASLGRTG